MIAENEPPFDRRNGAILRDHTSPKRISERYERKSTIVTSNLDIPEWVDAFANRILRAATVDRLRHGAYKVVIEGKSYRSTKQAPKP